MAALPGASAAESGATGSFHDAPPTDTTSPEAGLRLRYFGDYELLEEIARGGMGVVWKARQSSLHRTVALKMIRAGALASAGEVQRFLREAEAAANLQHPNIVAIHEVGEHDGQHYFSMDYVDGRDLGALVREGALPAQRAARYVKIIAEAIHFAHQRGTLHRDLKPQNVLIDGADQPRITDFGLAKIMEQDSRLTQSGVVMGSPSYMPPEQAAGGRQGEIGPHSDVYSLGAMLYELLTGQPPFRAASAMATLRLVLEVEPAAPRRLQADVPPDLETICLKCLEKSPSARYPSARALADELDRFLKGEPIQARPASTVRKAMSWGQRHPGFLSAAVALLVVGLAFASLYLVEENAFLRARQADPAQVRGPGQRAEDSITWLEDSKTWVLLSAYFAAAITLSEIRRRSQGYTWREWHLARSWKRIRPRQPIGEGMRAFAACAGLVYVGIGIWLLIGLVHAQVWEGISPIFDSLWIFLVVVLGVEVFCYAFLDYRLAYYGVPSRQLTADQLEGVRRAIEDSDLREAERLYDQAVPDAGWTEAHQYVLRLAETFRMQNPGNYVPPAPPLDTLNWAAVILCAFIELILIAIAWYVMPELASVVFTEVFGAGLLLGMGLMASLKSKRGARHLFYLRWASAVFFFVILLCWGLVIGEIKPSILAAIVVGIVFGVCLIASAFVRVLANQNVR